MTLPFTRRPRLVYTFMLSMIWLLGAIVHLQAQAPIAYYPFNGNANDESGNGHNGTVTGARLVADRFGTARSAYLFENRAFIAVPHDPRLVFGRDDAFTITAWIRACRPQDDFAGIVVKGPNSTLRPGYQLMMRNDSVLSSEISRNDGNLSREFGVRSVIDARWHFIALAVSSPEGSIRIYIDGVLDKSARNDGLEPDYNDIERPLFIGKERNSSIFFNGSIDDVGIYDRMLDQSEIQQLYRANGWNGELGSSSVTNITACPDLPVVLEARDLTGPYRWSTGATTQTISISRPGTYWVTGSIVEGCPRTDTFKVTAEGALNVDAGNTMRICRDSMVLLVGTAGGGTGAYTYRWTPTAGLGSSTSATTTASPRQTTTYYLTATSPVGCTGIDSVTVVVDALPERRAGADMAICPGEEAELGMNPGPGDSYTYEWIQGEGLSSTGIPRPRVRPTASGMYVVRIRNAVGCEALDSVFVTVTAPLIDAGPDRDFCQGDPVTIGSEATGGVGPYQYLWTPATGLSSTSEAMPRANPTEPTRYTVIVTDSRGCRDTSSVMVSPVPAAMSLVSVLQDGRLLLDPVLDPNSYAPVCDSVILRNLSDLPLTIDAIWLARNRHFSIPPSQLPFVIPAQSDRRLAFCYLPRSSFDQLDTILLSVDCGMAIPIMLRANALFADDCNTPIGIRMLEKATHFKVDPPYPNPAGGSVRLLVERASTSLDALPAGECRLYSSDGVELTSATYAPQSGWSRDGMSYERGAFVLATDELPAGIYYVRIRRGSEIISHPLVITR